ncbi:HipA N-terminal domain-containing protein [Vreelandella gomseomensis]|uniref:HipA N-terminal domain-containing protein n=1 Tax=Vreelandella gomseomensis TaxID=370766 RepID=A0ABU1GGG5_9GAMM|nr:HipA N-terminal domain-containing protein [Halomonas gomseomensis]MDR5876566.1 HipA N-terminal domain-containing protein [Halomonas gomseomensis]
MQPIFPSLTSLGMRERNLSHIDNPDRPTLGLAFKDEFGALLTDFRAYQKRVMPFFSNLLPEGHLRKYLSEHAGVNPERGFHLLWAFGHDLPGAVTIKPADGGSWIVKLLFI